ncbi:hypothetical protein BDK51DRAFT_47978 [Blyttiomyces helicus]|uniref:Uncharacterized protein n=1 Tax=Blyttiomyces helicus TaxID=388810 RepID=A0A4P9WTF9_9FUNG|nr:hypothetical protein BDK51DRAFT_47978 [Blyttiomyces helicus]|eukprot:RKO94640.1 hypothetical protein BDK51DRAFT_47978 [Blyttiomyces helicus]
MTHPPPSVASASATALLLADIKDHLHNGAPDAALALAELLLANHPESDAARYLLARAYLDISKPYATLRILHDHQSLRRPAVALLYARAAYKSELLSLAAETVSAICEDPPSMEGEEESGESGLGWRDFSGCGKETVAELVNRQDNSFQPLTYRVLFSPTNPDDCIFAFKREYAYLLWGHICKKSKDVQTAIGAYKMALALRPTLIEAYRAICELGALEEKTGKKVDPDSVFDSSEALKSLGRIPCLTRPFLKRDEGATATTDKAAGPRLDFTEGVQLVFKNFRLLGKGWLHAARFECAPALAAFSALPAGYYHSAAVRSQMGTLYFRVAKFDEAIACLEAAITSEPWRLRGIEYLSSSYYTLKHDWKLGRLIAVMTEVDSWCPETLYVKRHYSMVEGKPCSWFTFLNLSLRPNLSVLFKNRDRELSQEYELAIKAFERATKIDPYCSFALNLLGHEFVKSESWIEAENAFHRSMNITPLEYSAWYGISKVYMHRQEYGLARVHLNKAIEINTHNSILHSHLGMAWFKDGDLEEENRLEMARRCFLAAVNNQPRVGLYSFRLAHTLWLQRKFKDALDVLAKIEDRDANIHILRGRILDSLRQPRLALAEYTAAVNEAATSTQQCATAAREAIVNFRLKAGDSDPFEERLEHLFEFAAPGTRAKPRSSNSQHRELARNPDRQ